MEQKKNSHLLRRTLVPLLIVALPISAMIAYILYYKHARRLDALAPQSVSESVTFGEDSWPIFRGDAALTGRAAGNLPDKLALAWKFQTADTQAVLPGPSTNPGCDTVSQIGEYFIFVCAQHWAAIMTTDA